MTGWKRRRKRCAIKATCEARYKVDRQLNHETGAVSLMSPTLPAANSLSILAAGRVEYRAGNERPRLMEADVRASL